MLCQVNSLISNFSSPKIQIFLSNLLILLLSFCPKIPIFLSILLILLLSFYPNYQTVLKYTSFYYNLADYYFYIYFPNSYFFIDYSQFSFSSDISINNFIWLNNFFLFLLNLR